jgi:adenosylmethionine-8-amino-7-oxononanoate aminotransferase
MNCDSGSLRATDLRHLWHPYTRRSVMETADFPVIVRGEGVYLEDSDGRRYFDAISSWWCCQLGHGHPRVVEAIVRQARELQHSILGNLSHPRAVELAAALAEQMPASDVHVMFAGDGASAVEAALKIAVQYAHNRGRPRHSFASLEGAYHGDTLGAMGVGYIPDFHRPFAALLPAVHRAEAPCCTLCRHGLSPETCALECFAPMQRILDAHADALAGVIVEPLCQCAAGMRIYSPRYLRRLAEACRERDVLLIADEIAVGFGRTGRMFAFERADIAPDIVCLGKGLSAGYLPVSAAVVRDAVYDTFADGPGGDRTLCHGHTFCGNPIACAAALAALRVYDEERVPARAAELGRVLRDGLECLRTRPGVRDVRCLGLIGAVELGDGSNEPQAARRAREVCGRLRQEGVLARPLGNVVYLMPPLITPPGVLADAAARLAGAIRATET